MKKDDCAKPFASCELGRRGLKNRRKTVAHAGRCQATPVRVVGHFDGPRSWGGHEREVAKVTEFTTEQRREQEDETEKMQPAGGVTARSAVE